MIEADYYESEPVPVETPNAFGPFTGWTSGQRVYLAERGSMACLASHRKITTSIPVPLTLVSLERIQEPSAIRSPYPDAPEPLEVWLVQGTDGGHYITTHDHLEAACS